MDRSHSEKKLCETWLKNNCRGGISWVCLQNQQTILSDFCSFKHTTYKNIYSATTRSQKCHEDKNTACSYTANYTEINIPCRYTVCTAFPAIAIQNSSSFFSCEKNTIRSVCTHNHMNMHTSQPPEARLNVYDLIHNNNFIRPFCEDVLTRLIPCLSRDIARLC